MRFGWESLFLGRSALGRWLRVYDRCLTERDGSRPAHMARSIWCRGARSTRSRAVRSVAISIRTQRLGERMVLQNSYDPAAKTVVERYGSTQIPYELVI